MPGPPAILGILERRLVGTELSSAHTGQKERGLRRLVVGEVRLPALAVGRQPYLAALGAPCDESDALRAHAPQFGQRPERYFLPARLPAAMITKSANPINAHHATLSVPSCHLRTSHMV